MSPILVTLMATAAFHQVEDEYQAPCVRCANEGGVVAERIGRLLTAPSWMGRRQAARALRKHHWRCSPELVDALVQALLHDDCGLVRHEAAETLAKLRPCLPVAHAALATAAKCDSSLLTRAWARKGLKALARSCSSPCSLCESGGALLSEGMIPIPLGAGSSLEGPVIEVPEDPTLVEPPDSLEPLPFDPGISSPFEARPLLLEPPPAPPGTQAIRSRAGRLPAAVRDRAEAGRGRAPQRIEDQARMGSDLEIQNMGTPRFPSANPRPNLAGALAEEEGRNRSLGLLSGTGSDL